MPNYQFCNSVTFSVYAIYHQLGQICLEKIVDQTEKSRKAGLEIINVEVQIIMRSGTPGSQPWINIFTAFLLPSIGNEGTGFSKERLMMRGCASISRQATLKATLLR